MLLLFGFSGERGGYTTKIVYGIALAFLWFPVQREDWKSDLMLGKVIVPVYKQKRETVLSDRWEVPLYQKLEDIGSSVSKLTRNPKIQGIFVAYGCADHVKWNQGITGNDGIKESGIKNRKAVSSQCSETAEQNRELETLGKGREVGHNIKKGSRIKDRDLEIC